MKKIIIYPYKMGSKSATNLATGLRTKKVFPDGKYTPKSHHIIVNWGNGNIPNWVQKANFRNVKILNSPKNVKVAANKLLSFYALSEAGISIPAFTTSPNIAKTWLSQGHKVLARQLLTSHSGRGIVVMKNINDFVNAPLYTKYVKKKWEYRIHVFNGKVIDYAQKRKRLGCSVEDEYIRNHANGWVFCRQNCEVFESTLNLAIRATNALGLDFAALDVCRTQDGKDVVIEANTAAGLEGETLQTYLRELSKLQWTY